MRSFKRLPDLLIWLKMFHNHIASMFHHLTLVSLVSYGQFIVRLYFGHLLWRVDSLEKTLMLGGIGGKRRRGRQEDEMAGWHHWLDGQESGWTPGVGDGQGGLACCDSWGCKESHTTERLNWMELILMLRLNRGGDIIHPWLVHNFKCLQ